MRTVEEVEVACQAAEKMILRERQSRGYETRVGDAHPVSAIGSAQIPPGLEGYGATSTCTVAHPSGRQCQWVDYAFHLGHNVYAVYLQEDFEQGVPIFGSFTAAVAAKLMGLSRSLGELRDAEEEEGEGEVGRE